MKVRIASYNIRFGGRNREALLGQVLHSMEPHVAILQEATDVDVVERLAKLSKMSIWSSRKTRSLALLSRVPLSSWKWHQAKQRNQFFLEVNLKSPPLRIYGVHLRPHYFGLSERYRIGEIQNLLEVAGCKEERGIPHLLLGDFNAAAPGDEPLIKRMPYWIRAPIRIGGGRIKTRSIDILRRAGFTDAYRRLHPHQPGFTFPSFSPHIRIDYVFLSPGFPWSLEDCCVVRAPAIVAQASDHLPLLAELSV